MLVEENNVFNYNGNSISIVRKHKDLFPHAIDYIILAL